MIDPKKIWSSSQLPTLPAVAVKLLEISRNPDVDIRDIVWLIKTDPAISAKILKAANSTFFGFSSKVTSIDRAVPLLGTTVVNSLALSFSLVESAMNNGKAAAEFKQYWLQSIVQAAACDSLAVYSNGLECEFFLAGLLMDIGRLAMLKTIPDHYLPVLKKALEENRDLIDVEDEVLGINHAVAGVELMKHWSLPEMLGTAVRYHHASRELLETMRESPDYSVIQALAVGAAVGDYFCASCKGLALERLRDLTSAFYGFTPEKLGEVLDQIKERIDATAELFSVNASEFGAPSDLMAQANEQLANLAMREHKTSQEAVQRQQAVEQEKRELEVKAEHLAQQALHDPLTKLYNRSFFDEVLSKEVRRACRYATPLGIIFLDVDRFKNLNDTYGHQFGDMVLQRVSAAVGDVLRTADTLARYGGEEFVILVNQPTEAGMQKLAERIRARIEAEDIRCDSKRVPVTASVGAALTIPARDDLAIGTRLVTEADQAMYEAKQGGRNQVRCRTLMSDADRRLAQLVTQRRFSRWLVAKGVLDIAAASKALTQVQTDRIRVGDMAVQYGLLDASAVSLIVQEQERQGIRFGEAAVALGYFDENTLASLLACQQENPKKLATVLVQSKLVDVSKLSNLLHAYLQEISLTQLALV